MHTTPALSRLGPSRAVLITSIHIHMTPGHFCRQCTTPQGPYNVLIERLGTHCALHVCVIKKTYEGWFQHC